MSQEKDLEKDSLAELLVKLAKEMGDNPIEIESEFKYPMTISGINKSQENQKLKNVIRGIKK